DLIAAKKNVEVSSQNVEFLQQAHFAADRKYQVGEETITNVSAAQAELLSGQAELVSAQAEYENARAAFTYKTGITPEHDLETLTVPEFFPKSLDIAKGLSDSHNQNIIAARYAIDAAEAESDAATGNLMPSVDLSIEAARTHERNKRQSPNFLGRMSPENTFRTPVTVKAEISMPLYDGGELRSKRRQSLKILGAQKVNLQKIKNEISQTITTLWNRNDALKNTFNAYQEVVKASEQAVNSLLEEQKAGAKTLLDVLKQQKEHFQRQRKLVDTEKEYLKNAYNFLSIIGILTPQRLKLDVNVIDLKEDYENTKMWF
ncbi:MAG: TolC family protein, partial [Flavobacteriaceae bacterium]|nr:TolC family protein [Flavobacteriaceae bacterium]